MHQTAYGNWRHPPAVMLRKSELEVASEAKRSIARDSGGGSVFMTRGSIFVLINLSADGLGLTLRKLHPEKTKMSCRIKYG